MSKQQSPGRELAAVGRDDLKRILGELDDSKVVEILALRPTIPELEEAAVWAAGNGDVLAKSGRPLGRVAATIVDIMTADEEEEPD